MFRCDDEGEGCMENVSNPPHSSLLSLQRRGEEKHTHYPYSKFRPAVTKGYMREPLNQIMFPSNFLPLLPIST